MMTISQKNKGGILANTRKKLEELIFGKLARASFWMISVGIAGGVLGYVFQLAMGRLLKPGEFGLLSAMLSLFAVISSALGTLMMVVSRKASEYRAQNDAGSLRHFMIWIYLRTLAIGGLFLCAFIAASPWIQTYLKAPSIIPVFLLGLVVVTTSLLVVSNAFLQASQHFKWLSGSGVMSVILKILFSSLLVFLGYGITGALSGIVLAVLLGWIVASVPNFSILTQGKGKKFHESHLGFKPVIPVFIANVAFAAMTQLDMVIVNYYFSAKEAGLYAAASVLGKAVMYLPAGLATAMFPMVAESHTREESSAHLLVQALLLATIMCGIGALFYYFFSDEIIQLFYGEKYKGAGDILRYYGVAILPMTIIMVAEYFLIAKGRVIFAYLFLVFAPLQLLAVYYYHPSLLSIVFIMAVTGGLLSFAGFGLLWQTFLASKAPLKT